MYEDVLSTVGIYIMTHYKCWPCCPETWWVPSNCSEAPFPRLRVSAQAAALEAPAKRRRVEVEVQIDFGDAAHSLMLGL